MIATTPAGAPVRLCPPPRKPLRNYNPIGPTPPGFTPRDIHWCFRRTCKDAHEYGMVKGGEWDPANIKWIGTWYTKTGRVMGPYLWWMRCSLVEWYHYTYLRTPNEYTPAPPWQPWYPAVDPE